MAVIDTGGLILCGTVTTLGEYDNAGLGTWNGQPLSPTNQPTIEQDQLSATWNFYVDPAATNTLYVVVSDVADTEFGYASGAAFSLPALTGFQFSLGVPSSPSHARSRTNSARQPLVLGVRDADTLCPLCTLW